MPGKAHNGPSALGRISRRSEPYLFLVPAFLLLITFTYYPFIKNTVLTFFRINRFREIRSFAGFDNYIRVLSDESFQQAVKNTLIYVGITVPASIAIAFALALLSRNRTKTSFGYEAMFAMTMAVSAPVIAMIFQLAFNPTLGIVNKLFGTDISWLRNQGTSLGTLIFIQIWANIGYNYIFMLAAVRGLNKEVLESARVDGATGIRLFTKIIVPMVSPTLLFLTMNDIAYAMTTASFTIILAYPVFQSGGPNGATELIMSYVYGKAILGSNYNAAFAATSFGFLLSGAMMFLSLMLEKKRVNYDT
jgi:ABC-type sugar transport system permease subunit